MSYRTAVASALLFVCWLPLVISGLQGCDGSHPEPEHAQLQLASIDHQTPTHPLHDMATLGHTYKGFPGGLYPGGTNRPSRQYARRARRSARKVQPLNAAGQPDSMGLIGLLGITMSNATQELCHNQSHGGQGAPPCHPWTFIGQALNDLDINPALVLMNGAMGGQDLDKWAEGVETNYERVAQDVLPAYGVTPEQVQVVWLKAALKHAPSRPTLPHPEADAYATLAAIGSVARALYNHYPNLRQIVMDERIWGGWADSTRNSPEPWAYETAFAVRWAIEAQMEQIANGTINAHTGWLPPPQLLWGANLWANGDKPRLDGMRWPQSFFQTDGIHPNEDGEQQVGTALLEFFHTSRFTRSYFNRPAG